MVIQDTLLLEGLKFYAKSEKTRIRELSLELVLGVASKRCRGNGICNFFPKGSLGETKKFCHFAQGIMQIDNNENILFKIQLESLRKRTRDFHFSDSRFTIEEDVVIPEFVRQGLQLNRKIICKGIYPSYAFGEEQYVYLPNDQ